MRDRNSTKMSPTLKNPARDLGATSSSQAATDKAYAPAILALVLFATFMVYLPAINGGRLWDDDGHITRPDLQSADGLYRIWFEVGATQQYYPLLHTAFWLEHKLWGESMLGYHMANLFWHMVAVTLVYFILTRLEVPGALFAASLFALHPVMVESVAWVSEQKNTLSAVFYLGAMLLYLQFDDSRRPTYYLFALALFGLGQLTKTVTATLPAAMLVIFWWQRGKVSLKRDVWPLVPFFLLGAAGGVVTAIVERKLIGAQGGEFELGFLQRCLLAGRVIVFYFSKLIWPTNLIFFYPRWNVDPAVWWQWLFPIAVLAVLTALWAIHQRWRGPLAAYLLFLGTLFPVLGFLNVYPFLFSFVADHFQYLASLAVFALFGAVGTVVIAQSSARYRWIGNTTAGMVIAAIALLSWNQSKMYSDAETLYRTTIERNPSAWIAYNNLGAEFEHRNQLQAALEYYEQAIRLRPNYPAAQYNIGKYWHVAGNFDRAIEHYREALKVEPHYADARLNLGDVLARTGKTQEAISQYRLLVSDDPNMPEAHNNLGNVLLFSGQVPQSIDHFERALELRPNFAEAHVGLARALLTSKQFNTAIDHYRTALQINRNYIDAYYGLGMALTSANHLQEATAEFDRILQLKHASVADRMIAYNRLMRIYEQLHDNDKFVATAAQASKLARSAGNTAVADQIDAWSAKYRNIRPKDVDTGPASLQDFKTKSPQTQ
jgi:protein O-mannosyl-transferase